MVVVANKSVYMVLCNIYSCCSRDSCFIKDKGIVYAPNTHDRAGYELFGLIIMANGRADQLR